MGSVGLLERYDVRFQGKDRNALDKWLLLEACEPASACAFHCFLMWLLPDSIT